MSQDTQNAKISKANKIATDDAAKKSGLIGALYAIGRYFKGSWQELKQVRWPNRKSTWSMTAAVLIFSGFFVGLIVLLDMGFEELFKLIIK